MNVQILVKKFKIFYLYLGKICHNFVRDSNPNDVLLSLGLYVVYPAILWLLLEKFHGLCGKEKFIEKIEVLAACQNIYLYFTILLRTYKFLVIIVFHVDAGTKQGSQRHLNTEDYDDEHPPPPPSSGNLTSPASGNTVGLGAKVMSYLKCQAWMHLVHELAAISFVAFLILVCLPVLAFWFMFLSIIVSICNLLSMMRRLWKEAQDYDGYDQDIQESTNDDDGENSNDVEFQEFLSNFADDE